MIDSIQSGSCLVVATFHSLTDGVRACRQGMEEFMGRSIEGRGLLGALAPSQSRAGEHPWLFYTRWLGTPRQFEQYKNNS